MTTVGAGRHRRGRIPAPQYCEKSPQAGRVIGRVCDPTPFPEQRPIAEQGRLQRHRVEAGHVAGGIGAGEMII